MENKYYRIGYYLVLLYCIVSIMFGLTSMFVVKEFWLMVGIIVVFSFSIPLVSHSIYTTEIKNYCKGFVQGKK